MTAKAYKITINVLDFEGIDPREMIQMIENVKFLYPSVRKMEQTDLGEWDDDHPLNKKLTYEQYQDWWDKTEKVEIDIGN